MYLQTHIIDFLRKSVFIDEGQKIPNQGRAVKLLIDSRPEIQVIIRGSKIEAFEFKWNPQKKSRITKAFTNRYPDAIIKTITPENYNAFLRAIPF